MTRMKSSRKVFLLIAIIGLFFGIFADTCSAQRGHRRRFRGEGRLQRNPRESKYIICEETEEDRKYVESKCECPTIYAPVCGSDGVTYHNRCFIECKAKHQYFRFRHKKLTVQKMEPCDNSMHDTSFH